MIINTPLTVYHASYAVIEAVDLSKCRKKNDFGQGFYVTTDKQQAAKFVKTAVRKNGKDLPKGFVNVYVLEDAGSLGVYEFAATDQEWLHCVCGHRKINASEAKKWQRWDIIAGKIANDDTMTVINVYSAGGYGIYGSQEAVNIAISLLKPEKLKDQLCFKTENAIKRLKFAGSFEVAV
jgi:uncharacterized protein YaiE (UPF0345 family)